MRASYDRIDIDKQKSQTLRFLYNARVYIIIMRASYDSIDNNKLKQKMCGKVNKDITFI